MEFACATVGTSFETAGLDAANSDGLALLTATTTNTKSGWTQLIASTKFNAIGVMPVWTKCWSNLVGWYLADLGIGGAGSENVILPNIISKGRQGGAGQAGAFIPLHIPRGTRLSMRAQALSAGTARSYNFQILLVSGELLGGAPLQKAYTYGAETADSTGVQLDGGASGNTKGVWAELTAASSAPCRWMMVQLQTSTNGGVAADTTFLVDIGVGAASSEIVVVPDLPVTIDSSGGGVNFSNPWYSLPVELPAGVRIAARCASSVTSSTDRVIDCEVVCLA